MRHIVFAAIAFLATSGIASAVPSEKDRQLLADVSARLLVVAEKKKPEGLEWPPNFGFLAETGARSVSDFIEKDNKRYPIIRISEGMMEKVVKGDADRLAFILGHELAHILKGHILGNPNRDKTPLLKVTFRQDEEVEADRMGFELMLEAGYSFDRGAKVFTRMRELRLDYSSFEGLGKDHPSWNDRAAKADKDKAELWKAAAAFQNGVLFLGTENYENAVAAFEATQKEFPKNYQVLANLGYAQLMWYCDKWGKRDFETQGLGQVVVGAFYNRLDEPVRGKDVELWIAAIGNLRRAEWYAPRSRVGLFKWKSREGVILANLGLAHLLNPRGKQAAEANAYFAAALEAAKVGEALNDRTHAAILINSAVAILAGGDTSAALIRLEEGEKAVRKFSGENATKLAPAYLTAILYTRAMILAAKTEKTDKEKALEMLETYLRTTSLLSLWWDSAYTRYAAVAKTMGKDPKPREVFKNDRPEPARLVPGIKMKNAEIKLGDLLKDVTAKLGPAVCLPVIPGTAMARVRYAQAGIELLATDKVFAILLSGPNAPIIPLQGRATGAGKIGELKLGMTAEEVVNLLGEADTCCELTAVGLTYRFYREPGVAVRVSKGIVIELAIVQIPGVETIGK